jgi:hypothetical protein
MRGTMTPSSGAHYRDVMTETDRRHLVTKISSHANA